MSFFGSLFKLGILIPILLLAYENFFAPSKDFTPTKLGSINQQDLKIPSDKHLLIDQASGAITLSGWGSNLDSQIIVNHEDAKPLSTKYQSLNAMKFRSWNYFLMHTPTHVIQFIFVDLSLPACTNNVIIMEKSSPSTTLKRAETLTCGKFDKSVVNIGEVSEVESSDLTMSVKRDSDSRKHLIHISAKSIDLELNLSFDIEEHPSSVWAIPLSEDRTTYYLTSKRMPLSTTGSYSYQGKNYECHGIDCLLVADVGRGHQNYGVAYFWSIISTVLPDGRVVSMNFGDGIGSGQKNRERANEDFITIGNKIYQLDISELEYSKSQPMAPRKLRTAKGSERKFPNRECNLQFNAVENGMTDDGFNAVLLAFTQKFVYGHFNGSCNIDGEKVDLVNVWGFFEHVHSRW